MHKVCRFTSRCKPKPLEPPTTQSDAWQLFYETCYGILNLGECQVEDATLHYLWHKLAGHVKTTGNQNKELWILARQVAYWSMLPHINSKNKNFTPQKLIEFPWEKEKKRQKLKQRKT